MNQDVGKCYIKRNNFVVEVTGYPRASLCVGDWIREVRNGRCDHDIMSTGPKIYLQRKKVEGDKRGRFP